jgi:ABC-type branched-subunit amino acid transport system substrate-binding protein
MKQQNFRPKGFMVGPGSDSSWSTALGQDGDYTLLPGNAYAATQTSTLNTNLVNRYNSIRSTYNAGPPVNVGYDYTQAMVALQGISNAGSVDPVKVRDAISSINLTGTVLGTVKFDSTGRAILNLLMVQWQNEKQVIVYPGPQATSQLWYPAPAWSQGEVPEPVTLPSGITLSTVTTSVAPPSTSSTVASSST